MKRGGEDRATYLHTCLLVEGFQFEDKPDSDHGWTCIVDQATGVAYTMHNNPDFDIPRCYVAALIDAGKLPR